MELPEIAHWVWNEKYRLKRPDGTIVDKTMQDTWVRVTRALGEAEDGPQRRAFEDSLIEAMSAMEFMPAGRIVAGAGAGRNGVTLCNCLSGDTGIVTLEYGVIQIREVRGQIVSLLDGHGNWTPSPIRPFGTQRLFRIDLRSGHNGRIKTSIRATGDHGWVLRGGKIKETRNLILGDLIDILHSRPSMDDPDCRSGVRHGVIYGDGRRYGKKDFDVRLCGAKADALLSFFADCAVRYPPYAEGDPLVVVPSNVDLKALPGPGASAAYLRGFIRGWIATDGCVSMQPEVVVTGTADAERWLRQWGPVAGVSVVGSSSLPPRSNFGQRNVALRNIRLLRSQLSESDFLLPHHRERFAPGAPIEGWEVVDVVDLDFSEEVYCPTVPTTGSFALAQGVHSRNCFVMGPIDDSMAGIMDGAKEAALTLKTGGGVGMDFSTLRPRGALVRGVESTSSGAVSFMDVWDTMSGTIRSAGERRGAMIAVLRCDHPDIEEFVEAKRQTGRLTHFNVSVAVTDAFMIAVDKGAPWELRFGGEVVRTVDARELWDKISRSTYEHAEPGVIFIDRINRANPLAYAETLTACNPSMPAGTLVHTDVGVIPIELLEGRRFRVKAMDGTWADAECFLSSEDAELLSIDLGGGRFVRCTKEHRWPVLLNGRYVKVDAQDLRPGDLLPANRNEPMEHRLRDDLSEMDGFVAGYAFGNGSYNERKDDGRAYLSFSINKDDVDIKDRLENYFSYAASEKEREYQLSISKDATARAFIERVGLSLGAKDRLPSTVWRSNGDFVRGFVDGLICSDGYIGDGGRVGIGIALTNKDRNVVREFSILLGFHGVLSNIRRSQTILDGVEFERHELTVGLNGTKKFANVFALSGKRKGARLNALINRPCRTHQSADHCAVASVEPDGRGPVWDIKVHHPQHVFPTEWVYTGNCGEEVLPPYGACFLGSINLARLVDEPFNPNAVVRMRRVRELAALGIRALDNAVTISRFPLPQQAEESRNKRRVGLGITGLADALIMLGVRYGSEQAIEITGRIMEEIRRAAEEETERLGRDRGSFPLFDPEQFRFLDGRKVATRRNSHLMAIAPTGTISLLMGNVSGGIEPVFDWSARRNVLLPDGSRKAMVVEDYAHALCKELNGGPFGDQWVTATELTPHEHIDMVAAAQPYVDSAISKTINCPEDMPFEAFRDVYRYAYCKGLKGCTTYRPNPESGRGAVLEKIEETKAAPAPPRHELEAMIAERGHPASSRAAESNVVRIGELLTRPDRLDGSTYKVKPGGSEHALYVTINDIVVDGRRSPFEIFLSSKEVESYPWRVALSRSLSAVMRKGGDVTFLADELKQVFDPNGGWWEGGKRVPSLPAAIGGALERHMMGLGLIVDQPASAPVAAMRRRHCPKCQVGGLVSREGCQVCDSCDYTRC